MDHFLGKNHLHQLAYNPEHKGLTPEEKDNSVSSTVENCDDNFHIYLKIENKKVIKARWDGNGCAVSLASTEALLKRIENNNINEIKNIIKEYEDFINGKIKKIDGELYIFRIVQAHKSRIKCASAPIKALKEILENE